MSEPLHLRRRHHERARCALCHGDLPDVEVSCPLCATALHFECSSDVGRCPTLGCPMEFVRNPRPLPAATFTEAMEQRDGALIRAGAWIGAIAGFLIGLAVPLDSQPLGGPWWALLAAGVRGAMIGGLAGPLLFLFARGPTPLPPVRPRPEES